MSRNIMALIFLAVFLALSIPVFSIDFEAIRVEYSDSTSLDTARYVFVLEQMKTNEQMNLQHYIDLGDSVGVVECAKQIEAIEAEIENYGD